MPRRPSKLTCCCCAAFTIITQAVYNSLQAWTASGSSQQDSNAELFTLKTPGSERG